MLQRWLILSTTLLISVVVHAAPTTIQSWAGGLTNYNVTKFTDVLPTPSGWNAPATGQTQPSPPGLITQSAATQLYQDPVTPSIFYSDLSTACAAATAEKYGGVGTNCGTSSSWQPVADGRGGYCALSGGPGNCCPCASFTPTWFPCGIGYTASTTVAGQCNLSNPTIVKKPSDSTCTVITKANSTYSIDDGGGVNGGDSDCVGAWADAVESVNEKALGKDCCEVISPEPAVGDGQ